MTSRLLLVIGVIGLAGCNRVYLTDDVDLHFDFSLLSGPAEDLHVPYVQGTKVRLHANETRGEHDHPATWHLESSDERVLRIDSQQNGVASCTAVGAGVSEIRITRNGSYEHSAQVEVRAPTRVQLHAHGPLYLGRSLEEALIQQPRLLTGGTATFLVRYFDQGTLLHGNNVLRASASSAEVKLEPRETFLFEHREWLSITPGAPGTYSVSLSAAGVPLGALGLIAVTDGDVTRVELQGQDEDGVGDGQTLAVLAQAYDTTERPIFGINYHWRLDSTEKTGEGDIFRYTVQQGRLRDLEARYGTRSAQAKINARDGVVWSSNKLGCSAVPGARPAAAGAPALLLAAAALFLRLRRRGRR